MSSNVYIGSTPILKSYVGSNYSFVAESLIPLDYFIYLNPIEYIGSGSIWNDSSGNNNDFEFYPSTTPTYVDTTPVRWNLNNNSAFISSNSSSIGSNHDDYTIGGWVQFKIDNNEPFLQRGTDSKFGAFFDSNLTISVDNNNKIRGTVVTTQPTTFGQTVTSSFTPNTDTWYFCMLNFQQSSSVDLWVNDGYEQQKTLTINQSTLRDPDLRPNWYIGAEKEDTNFLTGSIGEVFVYTRSLSQNEMLNIFNSTKTKYGY